MGASFSKSSSKSQQSQGSGQQFPLSFLGNFSDVFGRPPSFDEILNALPRTQGLFGGGPVGVGPAGGGAAQPGSPGPAAYGPSGGGAGPAPGAALGFGSGAPAAGGGGAPGSQTGGIPYNDFLSIVGQANSGNAQKNTQLIAYLQKLGVKPGDTITPQQLAQMTNVHGGGGPIPGWLGTQIGAALPANVQTYSELSSPEQRLASSGSAPGLNVPQGMSNLGFGQLPPDAQVQNIRNAPTIQSPTAQAAQMNVAPQGFDAYQQALYHGNFDPVQQELVRQGKIADAQQQAQLAGAGLQSSGAAVGALGRTQRDRSQQLTQASEQAANQATQGRFGAEFQQQQFNAGERQQTALANAGFSLQSQTTNASNVLAGDTARAQNYLQTMGLNRDTAAKARGDFLNAAGLQEQDLARMDNFQTQQLGTLMNYWLQAFAGVSSAGKVSSGRGSSESSSIGQSAGISG